MRYWLIQGPDGRTFQVQAADQNGAIAAARQALGSIYGATDLMSVGVRDSSSAPFAPSTPALNFAAPPGNMTQGLANDQTGPGGSMLGDTVKPSSGVVAQQGTGTGLVTDTKSVGSSAPSTFGD